MTAERQPWFVDAWAVHDGRVFVSRRRPQSIEADVTVFMAVPHLQPVPIGRISTALRATRSGFQEGLRDDRGDEVAFTSLTAVRSLVARAYLAAGLGPGAPGAVAGAVPGPGVDPGAGTAALERAADSFQPWSDLGVVPPTPPPDIDRAVEDYAAAVIADYDADFELELHPARVRGFVMVVEALLARGIVLGELLHEVHRAPEGGGTGLPFPPDVPWPTVVRRVAESNGWDGLARAGALVEETFPPASLSTLVSTAHGVAVSRVGDVPGQWPRSALAAVPGPRCPDSHPHAHRLVEHALLPQVDRRFWERRRTALDLAPAVLVAALRQAPTFGRFHGEPSPAVAALEWLLPHFDLEPLPEAAERALAVFVDDCLAGRADGTPDPHPDLATTTEQDTGWATP